MRAVQVAGSCVARSFSPTTLGLEVTADFRPTQLQVARWAPLAGNGRVPPHLVWFGSQHVMLA